MIRSISLAIFGDQRLVLAVLDDQPPRRGAALAGRQIGRLDDDRRGGGQVLGASHTTIGLLPPSSSARILCGVSANWRWSDMPARAEPVNSRPSMPVLAGQRAALVGAADQQADDAFGHARLVEAVDQQGAGRRGLFRRLEHHRIAREQRRDDVAVGQVRREIIGAEHRQHAMRLVAHRDLVADRRFELPRRRCARDRR